MSRHFGEFEIHLALVDEDSLSFVQAHITLG